MKQKNFQFIANKRKKGNTPKTTFRVWYTQRLLQYYCARQYAVFETQKHDKEAFLVL